MAFGQQVTFESLLDLVRADARERANAACDNAAAASAAEISKLGVFITKYPPAITESDRNLVAVCAESQAVHNLMQALVNLSRDNQG